MKNIKATSILASLQGGSGEIKKNEMTKEGQDADSILEFANNVYAAVARCGSRKRTSHDF